MKLRREISGTLYQAIQEKYENGLYRDAILVAIFHLEECIRSKANLERTHLTVNPLSCFAQVFGGSDPMIKLNQMTTAAQIYEQHGFEQILQGLYQGIRVPRIHAGFCDDEKTTNAIIIFINYLVQRVQASANADCVR